MGKYLLIIPFLLFLGCETPQEKNKKEIQQLKQQIEQMTKELNSYKHQDNLKVISQKIQKLQQEIPKLNNQQVKEQLNILEKQIQKLQEKQEDNFDYIVIHPLTLITFKTTKLYSAPKDNSDVITEWEEMRTFTSYKEKNGFVKVTGYFIKGKWTPNKKDWWIKKTDCKIKILER